MKINNFLKSTLILIIGGCITKILGLIIKIYYTRLLHDDGISLYALIMPTYSLLLSISNFNIMLSVSKRISETKHAKKTIINALYLMFALNSLLVIIMILSSKIIAINLLKNKDTYLPLIAATLTIPFISIGYIVKGYFYGKQNVLPHMISNIIEQIFRLLIIIIILPHVLKYGKVISVTTLILITILNESISMLVFFIFLPNKINIKKEDLIYDNNETKELIKISLPSVTSRIIANIGFFLEPIIITNILLNQGIPNNYITLEYGSYNAYAISTLLFPSFFITAISNTLLPEISKLNSERNITEIKKRIKESLLLSLTIGILCTSFIYIFKESLLLKLYNTQKGINYIKVLAPFFILYYIESPLSTILISLNKIKQCSFINISSIFIKLIVLTILLLYKFNMLALVISEIINILFITISELILLNKTIS